MGSSDKKNKGDPQVENGYIRIATELYEQLYQIPLNASQLRIVLFIIRNTYGYHRKQWKISAGYISRGTGISLRNVRYGLKHLEALNIINVSHTGTGAINTVSINKKYTTWNVQPVQDLARCKILHGGSARPCTGNSANLCTGGSARPCTQHNIDKHSIREQIKEEDRKTPSPYLPPDWKKIFPEAEWSEEYQKMKFPDGTYLDPARVNWENQRE